MTSRNIPKNACLGLSLCLIAQPEVGCTGIRLLQVLERDEWCKQDKLC
jgi:hypothetical protein